ncbi:MAG: class I SAM-dependent methyltransferase [Planctomycetaceae bacterium]|nr:class I SAM-dependent methyltransferase [Planctomycetaceae bacterium]
MIPRVLEPEVMDDAEEAREYNEMDHSEVNQVFVTDLLWEVAQCGLDETLRVLDVGTGTALIPIELCLQATESHQIIAIDLAEEMLKLARKNVEEAGLENQVELKLVDAKGLPEELGLFDLVMSNSIVHHIPEPGPVLGEMYRALKPGGFLFVRDLLRPAHEKELEQLVELYAGEESPRARQLFTDSLRAALTLKELDALCHEAGIDRFTLKATSDRHWTLSALKT